jgi:hypothetical protein
MQTSYRGHWVGAPAFALAVAVLLVAAAPSPAPVAPRNCGMITVEGKRYQVKADQVRCRTARPQARRYLARGVRPAGFTCRSYNSSSTALKFRCWKGKKSILAIKR